MLWESSVHRHEPPPYESTNQTNTICNLMLLGYNKECVQLWTNLIKEKGTGKNMNSSFLKSSVVHLGRIRARTASGVLSSLENKRYRRFSYVLLALLALYQGGGVYAAAYYAFMGAICIWFVIFFLRGLRTRKGKQALKKGWIGYFDVAGWALGRQLQAAREYVGSYSLLKKKTEINEKYRQGFFPLFLKIAVGVHLYIFVVAALDKFAPGVALGWYQITAPLIDFYVQFSSGYEKMSNLLLENAYGYRLDYIRHTYAMPIFLTVVSLILSAHRLPRMFRTEAKHHFSYFLAAYGKRYIFSKNLSFLFKVILPQITLIPLLIGVMIYVFVFVISTPLTLFSGPGIRLLLFSAHLNRVEMFPFAMVFPFLGFLGLHVIKMFFLHLRISARLIRRSIRLSRSN